MYCPEHCKSGTGKEVYLCGFAHSWEIKRWNQIVTPIPFLKNNYKFQHCILAYLYSSTSKHYKLDRTRNLTLKTQKNLYHHNYWIYKTRRSEIYTLMGLQPSATRPCYNNFEKKNLMVCKKFLRNCRRCSKRSAGCSWRRRRWGCR